MPADVLPLAVGPVKNQQSASDGAADMRKTYLTFVVRARRNGKVGPKITAMRRHFLVQASRLPRCRRDACTTIGSN